MRFSTAFIALAAPYLVSAAPARFYGKRAAADVLVFKFADVLEQLESAFYEQAIAKFQEADFTGAGFTSTQVPIEQFKRIQADEATHSVVLQSTLKAFGETPITSCKFNFESSLVDVATMAATARVVENVGVAAYMGGATLLTDSVLLTAAASILTVEARHQTLLNVLSGTGTAIPSAFDIALAPNEVLALAAPFFDGPCDLGIPANPTLSVTNTGVVAPGTLVTFSSTALNGTVTEDKLFCQMLIGGMAMSIPLPMSQCVVPEGINGPVAIWITSDGQPLLNNLRDRATTQMIAGPTFAFIDTQPELLGQLARGGAVAGNTGAPNESTSTRTISPGEASSILAGAAPTGTDSASATVTDSAQVTGTVTDGAIPTDSASLSATDSALSSSATDSAASGVATGSVASGTSSGIAASQTAPTGNAASAPGAGQPGGPNLFTGKSADGAITVNGWTGA